ncbi:MAG: family 43 glycosylhydrolase [Hominilimicola sp.]
MNKTLKKLFSGVITLSMLCSAAAIPQAVMAVEDSDLLMEITFDEDNTGSGSFTAAKGGTVKEHGSVSYVDSLDEESGKALNISAKSADNYLELPDGLLSGKQAATFSFWIKATSDTNPNWAFMNTCEDSHAVGTEKYIGMLANTSTHTVERYNNNGSRLSSVNAESSNDWQYITVIFESTGTKLYKNGVLVASDNVNVDVPSLFTSTSKTWIGHANWGSGEGFSGMIDDFRIYGKALSNDEVASLSAKAVEREKQKLVSEKNCFDIDTKFYTNDKFSYEADGNNINVNVPVSNEKDAVIIGAAYSDNVLSNVVVEKDITLTPGMNSFTLENVKKNTTDTVKAFVWDSLSGISPIPDISVNNVFQFDTGSSITIKTSVANYLPTQRTVNFSVVPYTADDTAQPALTIDNAEKTLAVMESTEFSADIAPTDESIAYYKVIVTDITDEQNTTEYEAGYLPKANVSFPDASPDDTFETTMAAHDPSIFKDPKTGIYYAYNTDAYGGDYLDGSGNTVTDTYPMDTFKSTDLIHWERIDNNFRIPQSAVSFFEEIFTPIGSNMNTGVWAPDIFYAEEDTEHPYWLYYSLSTNGSDYDYIRSAIGLVKGESPTGPWTDCGIVLSSQDGSYNTNAIDSNIYVDTNGDRFFVWGSFQKGIHQVKLTSDGKAEGIDYTSNATIHTSSASFGTRLFSTPSGIMGPEGAYMINNTDSGYRYMFTSYGWLGTNYNIRIARNSLNNTWAKETSSSAHHKLLDQEGRKVGTTFTEQTDKTELWGYKMIGSYQLGDGLIYYGNGHCSVLHDDDGNWYLVEHCRKQPEGYAALQVHKMLWTEDGWPVVSPLAYAGEDEQVIPKEMLYGTWDLSSVGQCIVEDGTVDVSNFNWKEKVDLPVLSSEIIIQPDGSVMNSTGMNVGTWEYDDDHTVTLNFDIDGDNDNYEFYNDGDTMKLFVLTGYDKDKKESAIVMTGTDQNSITQFAKKNNAVAQSTKLINHVDTTPITVAKSAGGNPILGFDTNGEITYGGDPSVLVDGDTVYVYAGHDTSTTDKYIIPEYICYSSKDLNNWDYHGSVFEVNKTTVPWASDSESAWASQVLKHDNKYYLYYCTWGNSTYNGYQCIGVAVADSPTGPFTNVSTTPLINGYTMTTENSSGWNDIDPTGWIETDEKGVEHIYLNWGNTENYTCELNSDMTSVKDINGDGQITSADIKHTTINNIEGVYTEAPYLYRRTDASGNYTGKYYMFFAKDWREQWAYATTDDIMSGSWDYGSLIMSTPATSNTSHGAVFDFNGKTYFIYHNGSLPGGSGFRRVANIQEISFDNDGNVVPMTELSIGLSGTASKISAADGKYLGHEVFTNPLDDASYPLTKPVITTTDTGYNAQWEILPGKADTTNANYVSIQSVDKPGLYICTNGAGIILTQQDTNSASLAKKMTFKTVKGINGDNDTISFESVAKPGYFITVSNGELTLSDGVDTEACSFTINTVE